MRRPALGISTIVALGLIIVSRVTTAFPRVINRIFRLPLTSDQARVRSTLMKSAAAAEGQGGSSDGVKLLRDAFGGSEEEARQDIAKYNLDYQMTWSDGPGARYRPHTHQHTEVIYVIDGEMTFTESHSRESFSMKRGDKLLLPAGTVHEAYTPTGCTYIISNAYQ